MAHRAIENEVRLFALLERGSATSREIQDALGLSQPTVSRLTNSLAGRVLRLGRGRSTRYAPDDLWTLHPVLFRSTVRVPVQADHRFRRMPSTDSGGCQPQPMLPPIH